MIDISIFSSSNYVVKHEILCYYDGLVFRYERNPNGINWILAMLYAIEQINNNTEILPGIYIGYDIRDSCNEVQVAVKHSIDYLVDPNFFKPNLSNTTPAGEKFIERHNSSSTLIGIIGASSSGISSVMSTIFSTDYIPQISYGSTSAVFSDKRWYYRNFLRTVPSDTHQALAIVDLIVHFGWSYISAFAVDDEYGRVGLDELTRAANERGICLAATNFFHPRIGETGYEHELDKVMAHLSEFADKSHIVVIWSGFSQAERIMLTAREKNFTQITWIGTEIWTEGDINEFDFQQHIMYLKLGQPKLLDFLTYITSSYRIHLRNPWFLDNFKPFCPIELKKNSVLWEKFKCLDYLPLDIKYAKSISSLSRVKYPQVIAAVYALAFGLHEYLKCTKKSCTIPNEGVDYKKLFETVSVCDFTIPGTNYRVNFDSRTGEMIEKLYKIKSLRNKITTEIGSWSGIGKLMVNDASIDWGVLGRPEGRCSETCLPGSYRLNGSSPCCWSCPMCLENTITTANNQYFCTPCKSNIEVSNHNRTQCYRLQQIRITLGDYVGLLLLVSCVVGVLVVLLFICVFIRYWNTPLVKSSSREISMIQLVSLMLLFCLPVTYFVELTPVVCVLRTLVFGFLFTTVVAIILVKTYRLIRVFSDRFTKVSRFLHNKYQILFIYSLVVFELIAVFLWNWNFMPEVLRDVRLVDKIFFVTCDKHQTVIFWIVLLYIFILTLFTGYVAFRARLLPENYNDAQFISFAMFTACVIWITYVPLFFSLSPYENNIAFLVLNFVCTMSLVLILFSYKVKIILFKPHINSPEHARQAQRDHFLDSFHKDVERFANEASQVEQRPRLASLPVAVHKPSVFDEPDGRLKNNETEQLNDNSRPRRASFSSMSMLESARMYKSYQSLHRAVSPKSSKHRMKKSQSSPFLCDESSPEQPPKHHIPMSPSWFAGIKRVLSNVSMDHLLHHGHHHGHGREGEHLLHHGGRNDGRDGEHSQESSDSINTLL